ncbi:DNA polymerase I [Rugamonas aquatica]|uniref:DNA polymerase I n=1 Tax=Rugamonas aquatica TaxID=2743357 RepID=A0A6A7N6I7_9BURK|nr:DNA polymerase I [Rugamonas aquatica]MQA40646.1 DNA polymerase I [Rugamonas aquatica]
MSRTLLLVDVPGYVHRVANAQPVPRRADGMPVGAIHGTAELLRRLRVQFPAQAIACILGRGDDQFRRWLHPEYQASRGPESDEYRRQLAPVELLASALGWPTLSVPGVAVRDVMASLAARAVHEGWQVVVVGADQDLAQLAGEGVSLVNPITGIRLESADVVQRHGVAPRLLPDYFALVGDPLDNVPGVPACGPKVARRWLAAYQDLSGVLANAQLIDGRLGESLRQLLDWLPVARTLKALRTNCDLSSLVPAIDVALAARDEQTERVARLLLDHAPAPRAALPAAPAAAPQTGEDVEVLDQGAALGAWLVRAERSALVALSLHARGASPTVTALEGFGVATAPGECAYLPWAALGDALEPHRQAWRQWLERADRPKVVHGAKLATHLLANCGVTLRGVVDDVELASYVLAAHRTHELPGLAMRYLNHTAMPLPASNSQDQRQLMRRGALEADLIVRLQPRLAAQLAQLPALQMLYRDVEMPVSAILFAAERAGVLVRADLLATLSYELAARMEQLRAQAQELAGDAFDLGSPKAVAEVLFDRLRLAAPDNKAKAARSTAEAVLRQMARQHPLPALVLEYRSLASLRSGFSEKLPQAIMAATGRVHTTYAQTKAVTGRLAASDPPLQSIPVRTAAGRRVRAAFVAPPGHCIVSADYSQIELRILAHLSGDPVLLQAFARGSDVHAATAAELFDVPLEAVNEEQRRYAKGINFGLIYGMTSFGLAAALGVDRDTAQGYIERYFNRFAGVKQYLGQSLVQARANGYAASLLGRRVWLPDLASPQFARRSGAERAAINAPMQATAADLIKLAMVAVQSWLQAGQLRSRMLMPVHDELVLEVPDEELALVQTALPRLMSGVAQLRVPLVVALGIGNSWDQAH